MTSVAHEIFIKSRKMRQAKHVARMGVLVAKPEEKDYLEDLGVDERIILKWVFNKYDAGADQTDLGRNRDKRRALANAETKLRFT